MPTGLGDEQLWLSATNDNTGTSTAFNDQSGNGNNGTAVGTLVVADTSEGGSYAYDFDGSNDYIDTGSTTVHQNTLFTYSFWINASASLSSITGAVGSYEKIGDNRGPLACSISGDGRLSWLYMSLGNTYNSAQQLKSVGNVYDSTWHHVVCEFDGNNNEAKIYIDGTLNTSTASSVPNTVNISTSLKFGLGSEGYTTGRMDDVRVYNRTLTQSEITHLATARGIEGRPFDGLGDEQLWLCPSLENSPNDLSGNNNNGVYQNGMGTITDTAEGGSLAYDFDGTGDYIDTSNVLGLGSGDWAFSLWAKCTSVAPREMLNTYNPTNGKFISLGLNSDTSGGTDTGTCRGTMDDDTTRQITPTYSASYNDGDWHHFVFSRNNSTGTLDVFVDGNPSSVSSVNFGTYGSVTSTLPLRIGAVQSINIRYYVGQMDDIRQFDRVLTQAEITHLASSRGVEGPPPVGLGDEQLWLCPSLNDSANDISGNGNDGTYQGGMGTALSDGKLAYDFDGTDDYIDLGQTLDVDYTDEVSYSFWMRADDGSGSFQAVMGKMLSSNTYRGHLVAYRGSTAGANKSNGITFVLRSDNNAGRLIEVSASSSITAGQWTHASVTYDGSGLASGVKIYVNGVEQSVSVIIDNQGVTTTVTTAPYNIGARNTNSVFFEGGLDDMRQYDRVLTQAEITHLATSRGIEGSPSTPTAQYNAFATHAFKQLFQTRLR